MSDDNNEKNVILNDQEQKLLLDHNYDGIEEFDYPLPSWWVATFVGGIIFAFIYIVYYEVIGGKSIQQTFVDDMAKVEKVRAEQSASLSNFDEEGYKAWAAVAGSDEKALEVYNENCLSCHLEGGKGDIGPNLTDAYWLNMKEVTTANLYKVIKDGVEENGMPAWGEILGKEDLFAAIKYVESIKNTNIAGGKAPQGEKVE